MPDASRRHLTADDHVTPTGRARGLCGLWSLVFTRAAEAATCRRCRRCAGLADEQHPTTAPVAHEQPWNAR